MATSKTHLVDFDRAGRRPHRPEALTCRKRPTPAAVVRVVVWAVAMGGLAAAQVAFFRHVNALDAQGASQSPDAGIAEVRGKASASLAPHQHGSGGAARLLTLPPMSPAMS